MGIKKSDKCVFCKVKADSVDRMLLKCQVIKDLWSCVNSCLLELGFLEYSLTESRIILGQLENGIILTTIILLPKKVM